MMMITEVSTTTPATERTRRWPWIVLTILLLIAAGFVWGYRQIRTIRPFYIAAGNLEPAQLENERLEFLRRAAQLRNKIERPVFGTTWELTFTQAQLNGWLQVDLPKNHPDALPPKLSDPRLKISPDLLQLGAMYTTDAFPVLLSLDMTISRYNEQKIALHFRSVRLGELRWSLDELVHNTVENLRKNGWGVESNTVNGEPLLLLSFPPDWSQRGKIILDELRLDDGVILIRGHTE